MRPTGNCKPARTDLLLLVLFPLLAAFPRPDIMQKFRSSSFAKLRGVAGERMQIPKECSGLYNYNMMRTCARDSEIT